MSPHPRPSPRRAPACSAAVERILAHGPGPAEACLPAEQRHQLWRLHLWQQALMGRHPAAGTEALG